MNSAEGFALSFVIGLVSFATTSPLCKKLNAKTYCLGFAAAKYKCEDGLRDVSSSFSHRIQVTLASLCLD